jgi:hypothetical protein
MHFADTASTASGVATKIDAHVTSGMWDPLNATTACTQLAVTPLDGVSPTFLFPTGSAAKWKAATSSGDLIPQVACVVKLQTATRGRSHRGRIFLPFVSEGKVANGTITAASVSTAQAAWSAFLAAMLTATCPLTVASYKLASDDNVTAVLVESQAGTVRKRQPR